MLKCIICGKECPDADKAFNPATYVCPEAECHPDLEIIDITNNPEALRKLGFRITPDKEKE
jgi:hypothetical protein